LEELDGAATRPFVRPSHLVSALIPRLHFRVPEGAGAFTSTIAIDAYHAFDRRERGWIKVKLDPTEQQEHWCLIGTLDGEPDEWKSKKLKF
jgi:hypothetical protein